MVIFDHVEQRKKAG